MSYFERSEEEVKFPWLDVNRQATDKQRSYLQARRKRHFKNEPKSSAEPLRRQQHSPRWPEIIS